MKSSIGHIASCKSSNESGLILGEINFDNAGWKAQFSLDNKVIIERLSLSELNIGELKSDDVILERLIRDINSVSQQTREWASEMLCNFIEEAGSDLDIDLLQTSVKIMVDRIAVEDDWNVGQNLGEGIFEFIYLQRIDKKTEFQLVAKLAKLDKDYLHTYLDDEEYLKIKEVKEFIFDKTKWWNTGS